MMWKKAIPIAMALSLTVSPAAFAASEETQAVPDQVQSWKSSRQQVCADELDPAVVQEKALMLHDQLLSRAQQILDDQESLADQLLNGTQAFKTKTSVKLDAVTEENVQERVDQIVAGAQSLLDQVDEVKQRIEAGEGLQAMSELMPRMAGVRQEAVAKGGAAIQAGVKMFRARGAGEEPAVELDADAVKEHLLERVDQMVSRAQNIVDNQVNLAERLLKGTAFLGEKAATQETEENVQEKVNQLLAWAQDTVDSAADVRARIEAGEGLEVIRELQGQVDGRGEVMGFAKGFRFATHAKPGVLNTPDPDSAGQTDTE